MPRHVSAGTAGPENCGPQGSRLPSPKRRHILKAGLGASLALLAGATGGWVIMQRERNLYEVRRERTMMMTSVAITCLAADPAMARDAIEAAFSRMRVAVDVLTRFDARSPVAELNRNGVVRDPPSALRDVLRRAADVSDSTDGAFDITVEPVLDYLFSLERPVVLTAAERAEIARREHLVGYRRIEMNAGGVRFARKGMRITLDGIAKGYAVDQGILALEAAGIEDALIDAGGEVRAISGAGGKHSWTVGIVDPQHTSRIAAAVRLRNRSLSTSGNYEIFFTADKTLFHIINPHTGYSPDRYSSVTVVADDCTEADAMSTAAFSLPVDRMRDIMATRSLQWLVFSWNGNERWRSPRLPLVLGEARLA